MLSKTKDDVLNFLPFFLMLFLAVGLVGCTDEMPTAEKDLSSEMIQKEAFAHANSDISTATADLHPINGSGVSGQVTIVDDGETIEVTDGHAEGLDPENVIDLGVPQGYLSLFYDKASAPKGPEACEPGIFAHEAHSDQVRRVNPHPLGAEHPLFLTDAQMLGAFWIVEEDGTGTPVDLEGAYVPVEEVGTISIRDLRINDGFGPEAVVACGKVTHQPEGPSL
jgi:hypothetical protein